jgi:hypothetical protein
MKKLNSKSTNWLGINSLGILPQTNIHKAGYKKCSKGQFSGSIKTPKKRKRVI